MKSTVKKSFKILALGLLLMSAAISCKKDKSPTPPVEEKPVAVGTIDGKTFSLKKDAITSTYYSTAGDDVKALSTSIALDASGSKLNFFIDDLKPGTIALTKKRGTSFAPGTPGIKTNAVTDPNPVQTYVQYFNSDNSYYGLSGSIIITVSEGSCTIKWDLTFKDAAGRSFNSSGSITVTAYATTNPKPKSEINDPTPVAATPTIENISPTQGKAGDIVSITGVNYSTTLADNVVKFNGTEAVVKTATATKLTVEAPAAGTSGKISLKVKNSETLNGPAFTYVQPATLTSFSPVSARIGDEVTLTGTNFSTILTENVVWFNGMPAVVKSATNTKIVVTVPQGATTGAINLAVKGGTTLSSSEFVVIKSTLVSFAPLAAKVGETVTLTGTNFSTVITENVVKFNGVVAVVKTATATKITVDVPQGATTGTITLSVKGGATLTSSEFVVTVDQALGWTDMGFTPGIQDINLIASVGSSMLFTGGSFSQYLYYTPNGVTYTNVYNNLPFEKQNFEIHLITKDNTTYYITTNKGVAKSTDGVTWTKLTPAAGNPNQGFTGIVARRNTVVLMAGASLYTSNDLGVTWTANNLIVPSGVSLDYITSDAFGKYFYAVDMSHNLANGQPRTIFKSTDQGKTWTAAAGQTGVYFFGGGYQDFFKSANNNQYLIFSPPNSGAVTDTRLYRSTGQGSSWTKVSDEFTYCVKTSNDQVMYGASSFNISKDDGATWKKYEIPAGYSIGGIEKTEDFYYIICSKPGTAIHKIFRTKLSN